MASVIFCVLATESMRFFSSFEDAAMTCGSAWALDTTRIFLPASVDLGCV